jgi:hypothetical protein
MPIASSQDAALLLNVRKSAFELKAVVTNNNSHDPRKLNDAISPATIQKSMSPVPPPTFSQLYL